MTEPAAPDVPEVATPATNDDRRTWVLVIGLGVIGGVILGVILTSAEKRKARFAATPSLDGIDEQAPWAVSLQHLAAAWDLRFAAIEDQLRVASRDAGIYAPTSGDEPVVGGDVAPGPPPAPAAVSVPESPVYEDVSE